MWKNLTGLQKAKSQSQLNTSDVTLNVDLERKTDHKAPMTCNDPIHTICIPYVSYLSNTKHADAVFLCQMLVDHVQSQTLYSKTLEIVHHCIFPQRFHRFIVNVGGNTVKTQGPGMNKDQESRDAIQLKKHILMKIFCSVISRSQLQDSRWSS